MIMVEITSSTRLLVPFILVIMVSKIIADRLAPGVNHVVLSLNPNVHLLEDGLSEDRLLVLEGLTAHDVCNAEVVVLHQFEDVQQISSLLAQSSFGGYPVVDGEDRLI